MRIHAITHEYDIRGRHLFCSMHSTFTILLLILLFIRLRRGGDVVSRLIRGRLSRLSRHTRLRSLSRSVLALLLRHLIVSLLLLFVLQLGVDSLLHEVVIGMQTLGHILLASSLVQEGLDGSLGREDSEHNEEDDDTEGETQQNDGQTVILEIAELLVTKCLEEITSEDQQENLHLRELMHDIVRWVSVGVE